VSSAFRFERVDTGAYVGVGGMPLPVEYYPVVPERMADREVWFPLAECFLIDRGEQPELFLHRTVVFDNCRTLSDDDRPRVGFMCIDPVGQELPQGFLVDMRHVAPADFTVEDVKGEDFNIFDYYPILGVVYTDLDNRVCYLGNERLQERAKELAERVDQARAEADLA
jgi:hypothetical protein